MTRDEKLLGLLLLGWNMKKAKRVLEMERRILEVGGTLEGCISYAQRQNKPAQPGKKNK